VPSAAHSCSPAAHLCSLVAPHVSSVIRTTSLAMVDLQAELKRRHSGEDDYITIERQWERRCNLDCDFGVADTTLVRQAARTPASPAGSGGGCMALAPYLCMVVWPCKFWLHLSVKYNGSVNPTEFLQIYSSLILPTGGNEAVMANYFPVALTGTAWLWLMNLPKVMRGWFPIFREVEVDQLVEILMLVKKALNR
jgi:hypothetical protein